MGVAVHGFMSLFCRRRSKYRRKLPAVDYFNKPAVGSTDHEGIKTVGADNRCDLSTNSDLCICVVTWNMNGQVRTFEY